jgi:hypothetical protein
MLFAALTLRGVRPGFGIVIAAVLVCAPLVARAQEDPAMIEKITALNKKALDSYNDLEFEEARKTLKQALDLCTSAGLDKHPIAARTHIHMGVVLIAAKQQELGIKQFKKALEIQPDIQVTKALANPEILEAFKEAGAGGEAGGGEAGGDQGGGAEPPKAAPDAPVEPADESGIRHTPITRSKKGKPIPIVATVGADVTGFTKVVVGYRAEGAPEFTERDLKQSGNKYVGEIPADATEGNLVSYYIECQSEEAEDAIAASGSEDKPYNVSLSASAEGGGGGTAKEPGGDCEEDDCEEVGPKFFVALMGGIGLGYVTGNGEINANNKVQAGFAPSSVAQIAPEVGYFITPSFRLSLQLRYQIVSGTTPLNLDAYRAADPSAVPNIAACGADHLCTSVTNAIAVFARGSWFFGSDLFRPYFSLALGAGQIRHLVNFTSLMANGMKFCGKSGNQTCVDTVLSGPIFAGPGGGVLLAFTRNVGVVIDVNTVIGLPKFTYHLDFNGGVAARF